MSGQHDWLKPGRLTPMQRERAEPPLELTEPYEERWGPIAWTLFFIVGTLMWTAIFAWWLA